MLKIFNRNETGIRSRVVSFLAHMAQTYTSSYVVVEDKERFRS